MKLLIVLLLLSSCAKQQYHFLRKQLTVDCSSTVKENCLEENVKASPDDGIMERWL